MKDKKVLGLAGARALFAAALVCALAGCGSAPQKAKGPGDGSPLDPQLIGTWLWGGDEMMNELVYAEDNTITVRFISTDDKSEEAYPLPYRDNGHTVGVSGERTTVTLENGKLLWAGLGGDPLTFYRARNIASCVGKWAVTADDGTSMSYTFAEDGTYKQEFAGDWGSIPGASAVLDLAAKGGIDGTGTYTISGHRVTLTPKGGFYTALISGTEIEETELDLRKRADYPLIYVDGEMWFDGLIDGVLWLDGLCFMKME